MPGVEVDDIYGAGLTAQGQGFFRRLCRVVGGNLIVELSARQDARRAHVFPYILGIIKGHDPAAAVMAHVLVEYIIVLVPGLTRAPGRIEMAIAVRVHDITRSQDALQSAVDGRM